MKDWFAYLRSTAGVDLSVAHCEQHKRTAQEAVDNATVAGITATMWSSDKRNDTLVFRDGIVTGKKHWVSNIPAGGYAILHATEDDHQVIIAVDSADAQVEMVATVGMEKTYTGHLTFGSAKSVKLFDFRTDFREIRKLYNHHGLAFVSVMMGLSESLYKNICCTDRNVYDRNIELNLSMCDLLWNKLLENKDWDQHIFAHGPEEYTTFYSFAKATLIDVYTLGLKVNHSNVYSESDPNYQQLKDALIYISHMKNLYESINSKQVLQF